MMVTKRLKAQSKILALIIVGIMSMGMGEYCPAQYTIKMVEDTLESKHLINPRILLCKIREEDKLEIVDSVYLNDKELGNLGKVLFLENKLFFWNLDASNFKRPGKKHFVFLSFGYFSIDQDTLKLEETTTTYLGKHELFDLKFSADFKENMLGFAVKINRNEKKILYFGLEGYRKGNIKKYFTDIKKIIRNQPHSEKFQPINYDDQL